MSIPVLPIRATWPVNLIVFHLTILMSLNVTYILVVPLRLRARGSVVVEALCYKPEACAFETR
jgi:hypothetical protein